MEITATNTCRRTVLYYITCKNKEVKRKIIAFLFFLISYVLFVTTKCNYLPANQKL